MWNYNFYLYITTNTSKNTLYIGVTDDLTRRLQEHEANKGNPITFAGKYYCHHLIYYERHTHIEYAIAREKEIKKWRREKKVALVKTINPEVLFLNREVIEA
ncbi:GIY-YIG nuclease family protein [Mucilaginibacter lacusdianchii]|uniref:GIY-YIG nuclease family protein n=1 Tax=Mucilaginibacter lacusdianchii TaxID=2684211 RepID=UPI00131C74AB|nr:GIY-YIG nuclease family protein [Mucilaginibacter sp. JXJ CY 39]